MSQLGYAINPRELSGINANVPYTPLVENFGVGTVTATATGKYSLISSRLIYVNVYLTVTAITGAPTQCSFTIPFARSDPTYGTTGAPFGSALYSADMLIGTRSTSAAVNPGNILVFATPIRHVGAATFTLNRFVVQTLAAPLAANDTLSFSGIYVRSLNGKN